MAKDTIPDFDLPGKKLPQAIEAEQSLLGGLMLDRSAITKIADILVSQDFYQAKHRDVYEVIVELFEKGESIDILTVGNRLSEKGLLEKVGGNTYLAELVNAVPTAAHVLEYAKIIRKKKVLRDLIEASYDIALLGHKEMEDVDVLLDTAEKRIFRIAQRHLRQDFVPVREELEEAFNRLDALSEQKGTLRGLATGFNGLDNILAGLQKSDLILLASRPAVGKSSLALNLAANIAIYEKVPVGIFSLEMSKDQLIDRLIASQSGVDLWRLRTGRVSGEGEDNDFNRIRSALGILSNAPIFIDDAASSNVLQMRAMARRLQAREGLGLLIIDYLQLIEPRSAFNNVVAQITEISRCLKSLARELNIPVLALSQLSRAVERRSPPRPILADLRESGSLEQDADVVMFIYREKERETSRYSNNTEIIVAKHRNGPVGKANLYFDERRVTFREVETKIEE